MSVLTHPFDTLYPALSPEQREALEAFAEQHNDRKDGWKQRLIDAWMTGKDATAKGGNYLRQVRNSYGPSWLLDVYAWGWRPDLPEWEAAVWEEDENGRRGPREPQPGKVLWSGKGPPPAIGEHVSARAFAGMVTGYFVQDKWLGLIVHATERPDWHVTQHPHAGDTQVHLFGAELI